MRTAVIATIRDNEGVPIMAIREIDPLGDAITATEKEIAAGAWGNEDTDQDGDGGDRSLEDMGGGLEGQNEPEDDDETDGEEADGEAESEGEGEDDGKTATTADKPAGEVKPEVKPVTTEQLGRVPPGKHREALERARAAETERDALKAQIEKSGGENKSLADRLDLVMREIGDLKRAPPAAPKAVEPPKRPDQFEDPDGFAEYLEKAAEAKVAPLIQQISNLRVESSMAIAHAFHKDTFETAFAAINKLNVQDPEARATVQRIYNSPNPGEALVSWHKRNQTLALVGENPTEFVEKTRKETREALMKDPEFRKELLASLRADAQQGDDGTPRTTTRLPRSLARAAGSNIGTGNDDRGHGDDSEQAVADAAWR